MKDGRVKDIIEDGRGWKITEAEASLLQKPSIDYVDCIENK